MSIIFEQPILLSHRFYAVLVTFLAVLFIILDLTFRYYPSSLEISLMLAIRSLGHSSFYGMMQFLSASIYVLLGACVCLFIYFLYRRLYAQALYVGLSLVLLLTEEPIKSLFHRARPSILPLEHPLPFAGLGFPSGHSLMATVLVGALLFLLLRRPRPARGSAFLCLIGIVYVLLVGLSRIYVGAHYPSDVLGGYTFGALYVLLLSWCYDHWDLVKRIKSA